MSAADGGGSATDADTGPALARAAPARQVASIDIARINRDWSLVKLVATLIGRMRHEADLERLVAKIRIETMANDLEVLRAYGQQGTEAWTDLVRGYEEATVDHRYANWLAARHRRNLADRYSGGLMDLLQTAVRHFSANRFDMVVMVVGDAEPLTVDPDLMATPWFRLPDTRSVLYADPDTTRDITMPVVRELSVATRDQRSGVQELIDHLDELIAVREAWLRDHGVLRKEAADDGDD